MLDIRARSVDNRRATESTANAAFDSFVPSIRILHAFSSSAASGEDAHIARRPASFAPVTRPPAGGTRAAGEGDACGSEDIGEARCKSVRPDMAMPPPAGAESAAIVSAPAGLSKGVFVVVVAAVVVAAPLPLRDEEE